MDIYVGSIPFKFKEADLEALFTPFGEVIGVKIVHDKITRQNKGFGFVEMKERKEGLKAINQLNGSEVDGRAIAVSEAKKDKEGKSTAPPRPRDWNKKKKKDNIITWG
jgi:RNA recognition motif-containing protein